MSEPDNIVQFKEMVGRIIGSLYASHPQPQPWNSFIVFGDIPPNNDDEDLFEDTLTYLIDNGYITKRPDYTVRLNERSYHLLQKENPLDPKETMGASLARWATGTASDSARNVIVQNAGAAIAALYIAFCGG